MLLEMHDRASLRGFDHPSRVRAYAVRAPHCHKLTSPFINFGQKAPSPTNIRFTYLYRDAGNYKQFGGVLFSNPNGRPLIEIDRAIRAALIDGEFFDARKLQVPDLRIDEWDDELDHVWHEFESVEELEGDGKTYPSIEDFLHRIKRRQEVF